MCSVGSGETVYTFTPEQLSNAATIAAVGTTRGMPERAVTIALATALQESALRNIKHGDRDSLGLFQQRPSQGWGSPEEILDPLHSSRKFYEGLAEVPGYSRLPLTVAAQKVQRSGFPQAYAKHEPDAAALAAALTGRAPASLSCAANPVSGADGDGSGDPAEVRAELVRAFGPGVAPEAVTGGSAGARAGGAPSLVVPVRATTGTDAQRGWELAHWAVARSQGLRIEEVSFADQVWRADGTGGWRTARTPADESSVRIRLARH